MHTTIQEGRSLPELERCTTCCQHYHCPFCSSTLFQPAKLSKVTIHLRRHFNRAVLHEGYTIHRCGLDCKQQLHYHCIHCQSSLLRKKDFVKHLHSCKKKTLTIAPTIPALTASTSTSPTTLTEPTSSSAQMQMVAMEASDIQFVMIPRSLSSSWSNASEPSSTCTAALPNPSSFTAPLEESPVDISRPIPGPNKRKNPNEGGAVKREEGAVAKRPPRRRRNTESVRFGQVVADMLDKVAAEKQGNLKLKIFQLLTDASCGPKEDGGHAKEGSPSIS